jgi:hypothetical protein
MKRWWCRRYGHRWAPIGPLEHICVQTWCWRCWDERWVHLHGPYPHTCNQIPNKSEVREDTP